MSELNTSLEIGSNGGSEPTVQEEDLWSLNTDAGPAGGYEDLRASTWAHNLGDEEANPTVRITLTNTETGEVVASEEESLGLISPGGNRSVSTRLVGGLDPETEYEACGELVEVDR